MVNRMVRLSDSIVLKERAQPCSLKHKLRFPTEQEAQQNLLCLFSLIAEDSRVAAEYWDPRTLRVYQCGHCGHWHIGHSRVGKKNTSTQEVAFSTEHVR